MTGPTAEARRAILQAGLQAPSAENRHYLRFVRSDDGVCLDATSTEVWADQPHQKPMALMSYGAVVENMRLRALELGFEQQVQWWPQPALPARVACVQWRSSGVPADPLSSAIDRRHTNRRFYAREPLPREALDRLAAAAQPVRGAHLLWMSEPKRRALALRAIRIAETERFRREALHREMFANVRFELGWQASCDEGLPPGALEIEAPIRLPFAGFRHWECMRVLSWFGTHYSLGFRAGYVPCALSPHLGLIAVARSDSPDRDAVAAGQALQRVWLAAADLGLAFQPIAAAIALSHQRPGGGWVSAATQTRLRELLDDITGDANLQPWMLFRLGRAKAPSVVTGRPPVERYLD